MIINKIIDKYKNINYQILSHEMVRRLISILVKDIIKNTKLNIKKYNIQSDKCVRTHPKQLVCFSRKIMCDVSVIREFLLNKMWYHPKVDKSKKLGKKLISDLFDFFIQNPDKLENDAYIFKTNKYISYKNSKSLERLVTDKIASLTDRNALEMHKKYLKSNYIL